MEDMLDANLVLTSHVLAQLVGQVYEAAPPTVQSSLLEYLMRPLGVLALLSVGSGVFARVRFLSGRPDSPIGLEYLQQVCVADVMALVEYVMQRSEEVLAGLFQLLSASALMPQKPDCP
jgi:hypothetical protein